MEDLFRVPKTIGLDDWDDSRLGLLLHEEACSGIPDERAADATWGKRTEKAELDLPLSDIEKIELRRHNSQQVAAL